MIIAKVIIDASVVLGWVESEERSLAVYRKLKTGEIVGYAPFFLLVEVVNVLFWKKKNEKIKIREFLEKAKNSGINFVGEPVLPEAIENILDLMVQYEITGYDAQYVYLARKMNLKIVTLDKKLGKVSGLVVDRV